MKSIDMHLFHPANRITRIIGGCKRFDISIFSTVSFYKRPVQDLLWKSTASLIERITR